MSTPICPPPQPVRTGERSLPEKTCGVQRLQRPRTRWWGAGLLLCTPSRHYCFWPRFRNSEADSFESGDPRRSSRRTLRPSQAVLAPSTRPAYSPRGLSSPSAPGGLPAAAHFSSDCPSPAHLLLWGDLTPDLQTPGRFPGLHGQAPEAVPRSWAWAVPKTQPSPPPSGHRSPCGPGC